MSFALNIVTLLTCSKLRCFPQRKSMFMYIAHYCLVYSSANRLV